VTATYAISLFGHLRDTRPTPRECAWPELAQLLTTHEQRGVKDGAAWGPYRLRPGTTRGNDNVVDVSIAVGDIDKSVDLAAIHRSLDGYANITHSTYSQTLGQPRFRVVVPLTHPVPAAEWPDVKRRIDSWVFANASDRATVDASRVYWLPSCPPGAERYSERHDGRELDWSTLWPVPDLEPARERRATQASPTGDRPGDRFAAETGWSEILRGWRLILERPPVRYWRCPGSDKLAGWCASTGGGGYDLLYLFCNAEGTPFEPRTSYSKFRAYSLLEHDGDDRSAAAQLAHQFRLTERLDHVTANRGVLRLSRLERPRSHRLTPFERPRAVPLSGIVS
jgi:hypothetical protein